jgi:transcriptional regulator with XRE-family HTH domain
LFFVENFVLIFLGQFVKSFYFFQILTSLRMYKMKNSNSDLGQYLRELRKEKGQTLHQVSKGTDIDSPLLSKLERGERLPTAEQIKKLAKYYKVSEANLKVKATAERIIKEYGVNDTTYDAVNLVMEQITPYIKK